MTKKMIYALMTVSFLFSTAAFAESPSAAATDVTWGQKLKRGALNVVSAPVEIAREIQITSNERSLLDGWTVGLVKGLGSALVRLGTGAVDVVTFPFDFPKENKQPLLQPEYVWEKPGVKYS